MIWLKLIALTGGFAFVQFNLNRGYKKISAKGGPSKAFGIVVLVPLGVIISLAHDYKQTHSFEAGAVAALLGVTVGYILYLWWCSRLNEKE